MATFNFFRDMLDQGAIAAWLANPPEALRGGDTVVLGGRQCTVASLSGEFNYVIVADDLVVPGGTLKVTGDGINASPSITVLAVNIDGPCHVVCAGMDGANGEPGEPGDDGEIIIDDQGKPHRLAGGAGGSGGNGESGALGGQPTIRYVRAAEAPTASAPGGAAGGAGAPGAGGAGKPSGKPGHPGKPGHVGKAGSVAVVQVAEDAVWTGIDAASARAWAQYRTEVGLYFFRVFDIGSQLLALREFNAALLLDPSNVFAQTLRMRVVQQQTPTGLPRDIDISPDYKDLAANLPTAAVLVQNAFAAAASALQNLQTAAGFKDHFGAMVQQLTDRALEAQANVRLAQLDVTIANDQALTLSDQVRGTRLQIEALQHQPFDLGSFLTDVGKVATAIMGVGGIGAIVSIAGSIAAIDRSGSQSETGFLPTGVTSLFQQLGVLKQEEPHSTLEENLKKIGGGLVDLLDETHNVGTLLINFETVESDLHGAASKSAQAAEAGLLQQLASLQKQQMIAQLRQKQARDRVAAAQRQVQNYAAEAAQANAILANWTDDVAFLTDAVAVFISASRQLVDLVAEDVFLARRALEIYELDDASSVRFDYGYLHPDRDHTLAPLQRVMESQASMSALAPAILTWNQVFTRLNAAQAGGFDVVHPAVNVSITDPARLSALSTGGGLLFSVDTNATPSSVFELKVNHLTLELEGAAASNPVRFWIEHSGHWKMVSRRGAGSSAGIVEFSLFPHIEVFNCAAGAGALNSAIPAHPQSAAEPGPPFSFWGRGVIGDWRIYLDPSSQGLDLSHLSAVNLTLGCIGFAA